MADISSSCPFFNCL